MLIDDTEEMQGGYPEPTKALSIAQINGLKAELQQCQARVATLTEALVDMVTYGAADDLRNATIKARAALAEEPI